MRRTIFLLALSLTCMSNAAMANSSVFNTPLKIDQVKLAPSPNRTDYHEIVVSCKYFKEFMVKTIDLGGKGAEQLSIIPVTSANPFPLCQRENAVNEHVIQDWSGYFKGVKDYYVFFDADDGTNGGTGFAVFNGRNGKKIFEDLAYENFDVIEINDPFSSLKYTRAYQAPCSVLIEGESCMNKIKKETELKKIFRQKCVDGYLKSKTHMANARCKNSSPKDPRCFQKEMKELTRQREDESPSMISYKVSVILRPSKTEIIPVGEMLNCWPSD